MASRQAGARLLWMQTHMCYHQASGGGGLFGSFAAHSAATAALSRGAACAAPSTMSGSAAAAAATARHAWSSLAAKASAAAGDATAASSSGRLISNLTASTSSSGWLVGASAAAASRQAGGASIAWWQRWARRAPAAAAPGRPGAAAAAAAAAGRAHSTIAMAERPAATAAAAAAQAAAAGPPGAALSAGLPDASRRALAFWLAGCAGWVATMVVLGGLTRLTRSGLSMTEWKFTGERPPLTDEDWALEFEKYRRSPEFRLAHSHMGIEDFKFIYWMEYAHRMWGRLMGVAFAGPALAFALRGRVNRALAGRFGLLFAMGGAQGLVGWWMVRSGLQEPENERAVPRVSPYRLAAHLTSAFAIYTTLVWTSLSLFWPQPLFAAGAAGPAAVAVASAARRAALPAAVLIGVTAVSGAFVAGNDAGRAFNTFPKMNGQWVPDDYFASGLPPVRNAFENTAAVQLHHRALALSTAATVAGLWLAFRGRLAAGGSTAGRNAARWLDALALAAAAQVSLGVAALLTYVPAPLGAAHQAGALGVFTAALGLLHALRPAAPSGAARLAGRLAPPAGLAATAAVAYAVTRPE